MKSKNTRHTEKLERLADELIAALHQDQQEHIVLPRNNTPRKPQTGQLWTATASPSDRALPALVYIQKATHTHCETLLVHDHTWLSCHDDLVLDPYESPTGEPLVICLWNPLRVRLENLGEYVDALSEEISETIDLLIRLQNSSPPLHKTAIDHDTLDHAPLIEWEIQTPDGFEYRYLSGTRPLTDSDPRLRARHALQEAIQPLDDTQFTPPLQAFFERLQKAVANHSAYIPAPSLTNQQIPALSFGALPNTTTAPMRSHDATSAEPPIQKLHEFSLRCGPAIVNICISTGPTGITLDGDATDASQDSITGLQIRLSQHDSLQSTLVWQGTSDDFGEFNSPPLDIQFNIPQRLELQFQDHATILEF